MIPSFAHSDVGKTIIGILNSICHSYYYFVGAKESLLDGIVMNCIAF